MTAPSATVRAALRALLIAGPILAGPIVVGGVISAPVAAAETAAFVAGMGDVPVMPGLAAGAEEPLVFDKPNGRIVETVLHGRVERKAVLDFYARTLPQLGWKRAADTRFQREAEELRLEFANGTVRFVLMPR
ncbi:hypothetical protein [Azospirillum sp.]|uniref:hypothetical protein n=1 Tax=Azospirillum sp. TaxID=34012 RepID=UPI002D549B17|nr:hypothetical protein [Azospirillum sp.]HYD67486.1 hypothetical protein [Azospirillum sp.]